MLRNLLTVIGVIAVFGIVYLFVKPDWMEKLSSNPVRKEGLVNNTGKSGTWRGVYSAKQGSIEKDKNDNSTFKIDQIMDGGGQGFPSKNVPYILLIDKSTNQMRYWKLKKTVKKVQLTSPQSLSVQVKENKPTTIFSAYQMEIWVNTPVDLNLEFEVNELDN